MASPPVIDRAHMTYHQIAAVLGYSHTRVQQIEAQALAKIRPLLSPELIPDEPRVDPLIYLE